MDKALLNEKIFAWAWILPWTVTLISFVITYPGYAETDAMRYYHIAEQMMTTHHYLLSHIGSAIYADKPPLLFWLFIFVWKITGINYWWPQLLSGLLATSSILFTRWIAKELWPDKKFIADIVPYLLIGCFYWIWLAKQIRVDALLTSFVLLATLGYIQILNRKRCGYYFYTIGIALGILSKGPIILIFTFLPAIIFEVGAHFSGRTANSSKNFLLTIFGLTLIGIIISLLWAIPAAIHGGKEFASQIFYQQISARSYHAHKKINFLYYLLQLPLWLIPWTLYAPMWQGLVKSIKSKIALNSTSRDNPGVLLCSIILIFTLLIFSFFGQKDPRYTYPMFPFFALLFANAIAVSEEKSSEAIFYYQWPLALICFIIALLLLFYTPLIHLMGWKIQIRLYFLHDLSSIGAFVLLITALLLFFLHPQFIRYQIALMMSAIVIFHLFLNLQFIPSYMKFMEPTALIHDLGALKSNDKNTILDGDFTDDRLTPFLQAHAYVSIASQSMSPMPYLHAWMLTSSPTLILYPCAQQKPIAWYYQSRYSIISLWRTDQLRCG